MRNEQEERGVLEYADLLIAALADENRAYALTQAIDEESEEFYAAREDYVDKKRVAMDRHHELMQFLRAAARVRVLEDA